MKLKRPRSGWVRRIVIRVLLVLAVFWGGGIDTQSTLCKGTPDEVRDEVKRILDIMAPGGGFVFAPVHNIQDDVSGANFWAMWDTLMEYGKY